MEIYEEIGQIYELSSSLVRLRYSTWLKNGDECLMPKIKGRKKEMANSFRMNVNLRFIN